MRVAVVHHWFVAHGGRVRMAECIAALFSEGGNLHAGCGLRRRLPENSDPLKSTHFVLAGNTAGMKAASPFSAAVSDGDEANGSSLV
jgi:hypothetical protein